MSKRRKIETPAGFHRNIKNIKAVAASALSQQSGRSKSSTEKRSSGASSSTDTSAEITNANDATLRTNTALREGGIDYQVPPGATFDAKAFTEAALKRWSKVAARLAE
ncbi:MAG TPA: hypothetical protein VIQ29_12185 [Ancylobacter sp.]